MNDYKKKYKLLLTRYKTLEIKYKGLHSKYENSDDEIDEKLKSISVLINNTVFVDFSEELLYVIQDPAVRK